MGVGRQLEGTGGKRDEVKTEPMEGPPLDA